MCPRSIWRRYAADRVADEWRCGWVHGRPARNATTTSSTRSPARDFYSLKAFSQDIKETGLVPDRGVRVGLPALLATPAQQAASDSLKTANGSGARTVAEKRRTGLSTPRVGETHAGVSRTGANGVAKRRSRSAAAEHGATLTIHNVTTTVDLHALLDAAIYGIQAREGLVYAGVRIRTTRPTTVTDARPVVGHVEGAGSGGGAGGICPAFAGEGCGPTVSSENVEAGDWRAARAVRFRQREPGVTRRASTCGRRHRCRP